MFIEEINKTKQSPKKKKGEINFNFCFDNDGCQEGNNENCFCEIPKNSKIKNIKLEEFDNKQQIDSTGSPLDLFSPIQGTNEINYIQSPNNNYFCKKKKMEKKKQNNEDIESIKPYIVVRKNRAKSTVLPSDSFKYNLKSASSNKTNENSKKKKISKTPSKKRHAFHYENLIKELNEAETKNDSNSNETPKDLRMSFFFSDKRPILNLDVDDINANADKESNCIEEKVINLALHCIEKIEGKVQSFQCDDEIFEMNFKQINNKNSKGKIISLFSIHEDEREDINIHQSSKNQFKTNLIEENNNDVQDSVNIPNSCLKNRKFGKIKKTISFNI